MIQDLIPIPSRQLGRAGIERLPVTIARAGEKAARRFIEFFTANIRNKNARVAYAHAVTRFFDWCELHKLRLEDLKPAFIAAYIGQAAPGGHPHSLRFSGHWTDRAHESGRFSPRIQTRCQGRQDAVLKGDQARAFLDSIQTDTIVGLRDRAIQNVMAYSFARVTATVRMRVEDYYQNGKRWWFRFMRKAARFIRSRLTTTPKPRSTRISRVPAFGRKKRSALPDCR
jgi:integrase/recombinase XerD